MHLKRESLIFFKLSLVEFRINLQLTDKISLKLNSKSSLLLEYGHKLDKLIS